MSGESWSDRLIGGLRKTSERLAENLGGIVSASRLTDAQLDEIEDAEADAFVRAITQVVGLDPRSIAHGRGAPTTRHVTALESAKAAATAAIEGVAHTSSVCITDSQVSPIADPGCTEPSKEPLKAYVLRYDSVLLRLVYRNPDVCKTDAGDEISPHQVCIIEHCDEVAK